MIAGLLADAHANLPALSAALARLRRCGAEEFWNLGDLVGYGGFPDQTVSAAREAGMLSIAGNYDRQTLKVQKKLEKWKLTKRPQKWMALEYAYDRLSPENRAYLKGLPKQAEIERGGVRFLLVHGSPESIKENLNPETPQERLEELAGGVTAQVILCGHSHRAYARQAGGKWFVNPGSVGRPFDGVPRAALLWIDPPEGAQPPCGEAESVARMEIGATRVDVYFFRTAWR